MAFCSNCGTKQIELSNFHTDYKLYLSNIEKWTSKHKSSIFKFILLLLLTLPLNSFSQSTTIKRSPENRKDFANVYYKSEYTLFDLFTDEPIFPSSDGNYNIYISSNENKVPIVFKGGKYELEHCLF